MSIEQNGGKISKMYIGTPPTDATKILMSKNDIKTVAEAINENKMDISQLNQSLLKLSAIKTAGGTATAITLEMETLFNGYTTTFIATSNNSGAVTTINSKPLYKPNTTTAPTLVLGKAYTIWYNSLSNCFFVKASAAGTAVAGDVLAGQTFSNDSHVGIEGTMANNGNISKTLNLAGQYIIPQGYHAGDGKITAPSLPILTKPATAADIKNGKQVIKSDGTIMVGAAPSNTVLMYETNGYISDGTELFLGYQPTNVCGYGTGRNYTGCFGIQNKTGSYSGQTWSISYNNQSMQVHTGSSVSVTIIGCVGGGTPL